MYINQLGHVYLEEGDYIEADGVAWASWQDTSATDFCEYF
jgi:hypothetical protein